MDFHQASYAPPALEDQNAVIASLLVLLRRLADGFASVYGAPAEMVKRQFDLLWGEKPRERAWRWLHDMACVARRLILMRAMQMEKPPHVISEIAQEAPAASGGGRPRETANLGYPEDSSLWRVRFAAGSPFDAVWLKAERHKESPARASKCVVYSADDPRPLAERFEALRRVIDDLDLHAAKLAARLHRWKGRQCRLEKFLSAMCAAALIANAAGLDDQVWEPFGAARIVAQDMTPLYLRVESG